MEKQITLMETFNIPNKNEDAAVVEFNKRVADELIWGKPLNLKDYFFTMQFDPTDDPHIKDRHPQTLEPLDYE